MVEAGILSEDDRVELIEGEIIKTSPIGSYHAACVKRLNALLNRRLGVEAIVSVQDPIRLDDYSEPEPDIVLLKRRDGSYARSLPAADDALLIIEVADTSADYDRDVKLPLYARAGILEVWLANLANDQVEPYSQPASGIYRTVRYAGCGESLARICFPNMALSVDEILG